MMNTNKMLQPDPIAPFDASETAAQLGTRSRETRTSTVLWSACVEWDGIARRGRIRNISSRGMMIEVPMNLRLGSEVAITIDGTPRLVGRVRWVQGCRFGLHLDRKIDVREVELAQLNQVRGRYGLGRLAGRECVPASAEALRTSIRRSMAGSS